MFPRVLAVAVLLFVSLTVAQSNATELINQIAADIESAVDCASCHALLIPLKALALLGDDVFTGGIVGICDLSGAEDPDVCAGAVGGQAPIIAHGLRLIDPLGQTATKLCNALFGLCALPPVNEFTLPLPPAPASPKKFVSRGRPPLTVAHLSDVHIDREYTVGADAQCTKPLCCRNFADQAGQPIAEPAGPSGNSNCDSPVKLADAMLSAVKGLNPDFAIFTGDIVEGAIWLVDRAEVTMDLSAFDDEMGSLLGTIPVFPAIGNHDSAPVNSFPRDEAALTAANNSASSSQWVFDTQAQGWQRWINTTAAQEVRHISGSYGAVVPGTKLRIISLNTQYYYKQNFWLYDTDAVVHDPQGLLAFVGSQLQLAETLGERVWIIGHISSGKTDFNRDPSNYFNQLVQRYSNTIAGNFFGHSHKDQFEITYKDFNDRTAANANSVNIISPALTPTSGNPAFKFYDIDPDTYELMDVRVFFANVSSPTFQTSPTFELYYSARESYGALLPQPIPATQPLSPAFWHNLTEVFESDDEAFQLYNERLSRGGAVGACDADCKANTICNLRAARSENNCDVATPGLSFKRSLPRHSEESECEGLSIATVFRSAFISIIALAVSAATAVVAQRDPAVLAALNARPGFEAREISDFEGGSLVKRACTASSCNCSGFPPGLFCGDGVLNCKKGNVYQCSTDGHTTCSYGVRTSCQKCNALTC
ncbi:sphingomyelin phosphodiesterase [Exidia glandulosa HHB12029]|uniref:Sphingomyelin phosphodiesterase n=1 Tax=Exidia glandulosa HHB12029 TaxID=1314781 RepID=A0A165JXL9_EXIGL|nr:sphingomyelin phosphodiesterase [Exidia glandulosa HHB12029]